VGVGVGVGMVWVRFGGCGEGVGKRFSLAEVFHRLSTGHKKTPQFFGGVRASVLEVFVPLPYAHGTEQS